MGIDQVDRFQERFLLEPGKSVSDLRGLGRKVLQRPSAVLGPEDLHGAPAEGAGPVVNHRIGSALRKTIRLRPQASTAVSRR